MVRMRPHGRRASALSRSCFSPSALCRSFSLGRTSASAIATFSSKMRPFNARVSSMGCKSFGFSSTAVSFGSSMCSPSAIAGVTTMKMMSRTNTTSTSGVTLISGSGSLLFRILGMLLAMIVLHLVEQLAHGTTKRELDSGHARRQVVVEKHGRDGDHQAESRLDQGLRDAGHDRPEASAAALSDGLESANDADHRAEQADEGSHRTY